MLPFTLPQKNLEISLLVGCIFHEWSFSNITFIKHYKDLQHIQHLILTNKSTFTTIQICMKNDNTLWLKRNLRFISTFIKQYCIHSTIQVLTRAHHLILTNRCNGKITHPFNSPCTFTSVQVYINMAITFYPRFIFSHS